MNNDLLPCPFCGSDDVMLSIGTVKGLAMVICLKCGATVSFQGKENRKQATAAWNTRHEPEAREERQ